MLMKRIGTLCKRHRNKRGLSRKQLSMLMSTIFATKDRELTCDECFEKLDAYAEHSLLGRETGEAFLLVEDHLTKCMECREEYELLAEALKAQIPLQ